MVSPTGAYTKMFICLKSFCIREWGRIKAVNLTWQFVFWYRIQIQPMQSWPMIWFSKVLSPRFIPFRARSTLDLLRESRKITHLTSRVEIFSDFLPSSFEIPNIYTRFCLVWACTKIFFKWCQIRFSLRLYKDLYWRSIEYPSIR